MTSSTELIAKIDNLRGIWANSIEGECPVPQQFGRWLLIHHGNEELVAWGIRELAVKLTKKPMNDEYKIRFVSSVINNQSHAGSGQ